jgi:hypothetical protein
MSTDLSLDHIGIRKIVPNNVPQMKKTIRINSGELQGHGSDTAAVDLAVNFNADFAFSCVQQNTQATNGSRLQIRLDGEQTAPHAEIHNLFDPKDLISGRQFGIKFNGDTAEFSFVLRHEQPRIFFARINFPPQHYNRFIRRRWLYGFEYIF